MTEEHWPAVMHINCVCPGYTETQMGSAVYGSSGNSSTSTSALVACIVAAPSCGVCALLLCIVMLAQPIFNGVT